MAVYSSASSTPASTDPATAATGGGVMITLDAVDFTTTAADMPALWFGSGASVTAYLDHTRLTAASGVVVAANRSQVARTFDRFDDSATTSIAPTADLYVTNSRLVGDIVAVQDSTINLNLGPGSTLVGTVRTDSSNATVNVRLTSGARWTMTANARVGSLTTDAGSGDAAAAMNNVVTNGHRLMRVGVDS